MEFGDFDRSYFPILEDIIRQALNECVPNECVPEWWMETRTPPRFMKNMTKDSHVGNSCPVNLLKELFISIISETAYY